MAGVLLRIRGLKTNFYTYQGVVKALDGIDLQMAKGETLGVVGETGSGKSVTALSILRLIPSPPGKVEAGEALFDVPQEEFERLEVLREGIRTLAKDLFGASDPLTVDPLTAASLEPMEERLAQTASLGKEQREGVVHRLRELRELLARYDLLSKTDSQLRAIRGNQISMIFQEPMQALNPVFTVGDQIAESILLHRPKAIYRKVVLQMRREDLRRRVVAGLLDTFRLRKDLPAAVDLENPTRGDLQVVWGLLSREPPKDPALMTNLRGLMELEDLLGDQSSRRSVYSRWIPKSFQARMYADLWSRGGWRAADVLAELESVRAPPWAEVRELDEYTLGLSPRVGTGQDLAKAVSKMLNGSRSAPSMGILGRVLEPPLAEKGQILLRVKEPNRALSVSPVARLLNRIPAFRRALNGPMRRQAIDEAAEILRDLKIPDAERVVRGYPHELSGGMQQRAVIAIALSCNPLLLIADEPTTALDVTIQAQILALLKELKRQGRPSILIITHDLGVIADMCDRVSVMYGGVVVEDAPLRQLFNKPLHPYTQGLIKAIPSHAGRRDRLEVIPGSVPNLIYPPGGCRFHPRCPAAMPHCGWDATDLEKALRKFLEEVGIGTDSDVRFESSRPTGLKVSFGEVPDAEAAMAHMRSRMAAEREASPLFQAVTEIAEEAGSLMFTIVRSRRPQHLEVEPGHRVSCYLYEPAPEGI